MVVKKGRALKNIMVQWSLVANPFKTVTLLLPFVVDKISPGTISKFDLLEWHTSFIWQIGRNCWKHPLIFHRNCANFVSLCLPIFSWICLVKVMMSSCLGQEDQLDQKRRLFDIYPMFKILNDTTTTVNGSDPCDWSGGMFPF